ncbi:MAG TPA: prolyl oligopeptidase family serine peptidase [Gemmatimonadaceae bacterium]|nr:prolyl oligopeptidase family serine peptidase [Gemmatimonadaceae bacterium]
MPIRRRLPLTGRWQLAAAALLASTALPVRAQDVAQQGALKEILAKETFIRPPAAIEKIVTAPWQQNVSLTNQSPDHKHFLKLESEGMPSVQQFGKPHYYLGGLQVDYKANRARTLTTRGAAGLEIIDASTGQTRTIETPKGATVSSPKWSPDGSEIAYLANFDDATHLYVADVATGKSRRVSKTPLLATLVTAPEWTNGGKSLVTVLVPEGRGAEPQHPAIETGPQVRMVGEAKNKTRTYREYSLLHDPHESAQLEYYTTGQLALVDAKSGAVKKIGAPAMITAVDPSPDGAYYRVTTMQKPFSYLVQYQNFGTLEQVWDAAGKPVAELAKRPLRAGDNALGDDAPGGAPADTGKRSFGWLPNGKGLYYLQMESAVRGAAPADSAASDEPGNGRGGRGAARRDHLYVWDAPFTAGSARQLFQSNNRIGDLLWSEDGQLVFAAENANGNSQVYATYLSEPTKHYPIARIRGVNLTLGTLGNGRFGGGGRGGNGADSVTFYQNPGTLMSRPGRTVSEVALLSSDGNYAYLSGTQYFHTWADSAPRPFIDRVEIKTGKKDRVFQSAADVYERIAAPLDDDFARAIVVRESPTMVPDSYLRDMKSGQVTQLTHNRDYAPEISQAMRKRVPVTRADGYRFFVDVTLPRDYKEGTRLPAFFWFYPYEYTDQAGYDRTKRTENRNQFHASTPNNKELLITQGYAVVQPDAPIVGPSGRMNDNYVNDLRNNLSAVIDELDRLGYIDRSRLGIGGHSYGAFSTVNAMVHTPFFKAGIAGDGAYNRTLTPNNFQSERRDLWEARDTYLAMSPFLYADHLTGNLLMYLGAEDQNVGTDPTNSLRLLHALQGMGKTAALYIYPYEDHGQVTKETILDQWARFTAWLDLYVKSSGKTDKKIAVVP